MAYSVRKHLINLLCKSLGRPHKDNVSVISAFKLNVSCDIRDNNFILKISEKVLKDLFKVGNGIEISKLATDDVVQAISLNKYSGDTFYTFQVNKNIFIKDILDEVKSTFAANSSVNKETVIVEYSSPNIAKPFHMGHLRSTVIGQFVANILNCSYNVIRINYLGDWGTQFGLIQAGIKDLSVDIDNVENPLKLINDAYIHANKDSDLVQEAKHICSTLEKSGGSQELQLWNKLRDMTVRHLENTYALLGIHFDEYAWESQYISNFDPVFNDMKHHGVIEEVDGQLMLSRGGRKLALMKSDGTSLYLSRDILAALDRHKRHSCKSMMYVIDKSQSDHVDAVKYVVSLLTDSDPVQHVMFGKIIGMSTRKGTGIFLTDILDTATKLMAQQQQNSPNTRSTDPEVTRTLALSTLVVYMLKQRRTKDFTFNWDTALQGKGDSGVKVQYTHCRLCSLEENCSVQLPGQCLPHLITEPEALGLISLLDKHDQMLMISQSTLESYHLVNYLFKLCNATSLCLKKLPVKGESRELAEQRLLLFHKTRLVLRSIMLILGLKPLRSM